MLPSVLSLDGLGLLQFQMPQWLPFPLFILATFAGPTLAAYLVTAALEGKPGMLRLFRRYGQWRVGPIPWLLAVFAYPLLLIVVGSILLQGAPLQALAANPLTFFTAYLPALLIFPALITWGEEPGWRGVALTRMQMAYHPLIAALAVGFMHALWHLPMYVLVSGPNAAGPWNTGAVITNTVVIMLFTIFWSWVFNRARGSILIAVLLHASVNATPIWLSSFAPELMLNQTVSLVSMAVVLAAVILIVVLTRGRLGYPRPTEM
jgi:membrane protease YdiL (CAAX protease family)